MHVLYIVLLSLALSWIFSGLLGKLKLPRVLSPIIAGILLGIEPINSFLFDTEAITVMSSFADIGLVFLMFYVGFELNTRDMLKTGKQSVYISIFCVITAFLLGFGVGKLLGFSNLVSVILGATLSVSAEAIAVNILEEANMLKSRIGAIVVSAGLIDNLIEIAMIAVLVAFTETSSVSPLLLVPFVILLGFAVFVFYRFVIPRFLLIAENYNLETNIFMVSVIMALVFSVLSEYMGFGFIIGALLAGAVMNRAIAKHMTEVYRKKRKTLFDMTTKQFEQLKMKMKEHELTLSAIKTTTFGFLVPFFFIWIGLNVDLTSIFKSPLLILLLTIAAFSGQLIGATVGNLLAKGTLGEGFIIGWALNSRGSVELVFAEIARSSNIISGDVFSAIVFMSLLTTFFSPVMFKYLVLRQKHKKRI